MSRSNSGTAMGIAKKSPPRSQGRKTRPAVQDKAVPAKTGSNQSLQVEWEDESEELDELPDISNMLDKPAPEQSCDSAVRRRIEMLREERQLQQALSEVFDF